MIIQNDKFWSMSSTNRNTSSTDAGFRQKRRSTCQGKMQNERFFQPSSDAKMPACIVVAGIVVALLLHKSTTRIIWASKSSCARASQLMSQSWFSTASKQQIFVFFLCCSSNDGLILTWLSFKLSSKTHNLFEANHWIPESIVHYELKTLLIIILLPKKWMKQALPWNEVRISNLRGGGVRG